MADAMEPGRVTFDDKMVVRKAIEDAGIPFTYVSGNCFAGYFVGGLCQFGHILPSKDSVVLYGDGNQKLNSHSPYGQRTAIICLKDGSTPSKYPRDPGTPTKSPL